MGRRVELDNRGLAPPEPMTRILEALEGMAEGDVLVAINERRPLFLYPELEELGWAHDTEAMADGTFRITVWRPERG